EEDDIVGSDLCPAAGVGSLADELAGLQYATRVAIAPAVIVHDRLGHDLLHPPGNDLALDDRIADILPVDLDAMLLKLFSNIDDVPDLVGQLPGSGPHQFNS